MQNLTLENIKQLTDELKQLPDIRKELKAKFCSDMKCEYYDIAIIANPKYRENLGNYGFITYNKNVDDIIFVDTSCLTV